MSQLVLMVGVPGSGKSTVAKQLVDRGYVYLNADDIRRELWGDAADQREPRVVFDTLNKRLEEALSAGSNVVVDNTNINSKHRRPLLEIAKNAGYTDVQLWVMDVPLELCLSRNKGRQRCVPEDIVTNYFNTLNSYGRPKPHEGKIVVVRPGSKDFEYKFFQTK